MNRLNPGGDSFDKSPNFSDGAKIRLSQHFSRIQGTLKFWKNQAQKYHQFHNYVLGWTTAMSMLIPILLQFLDNSSESRIFFTVATTHIAILLAFHRALKVEKNYQAFREGESQFYDLMRQLMDRPYELGENEEQQLQKYFRKCEKIRKEVRNAEIDNFPKVESKDSS